MRILKFVFVATLISIAIFQGTKAGARVIVNGPSTKRLNSVVAKTSGGVTYARDGQALVAVDNGVDRRGETEWANIKGTNLDSGAASEGMVLGANGSGGADWVSAQALPALPKCKVSNSAPQPITPGVDNKTAVTTTLTFDTNDHDVGGFHSTSVDQSKLTVPSAGYYTIKVNLKMTDGSGAVVSFRQNGTKILDVANTTRVGINNVVFDTATLSTDVYLNANDFIEVIVATIITPATNFSSDTHFMITKLP